MRNKIVALWFVTLFVTSVLALGGTAGALIVADSYAQCAEDAMSLTPGRLDRTFAAIVQAVSPSIVNIRSSTIVRVPPEELEQILQNPVLREFFRQQSPEMLEGGRERREQSVGSGVIVSSEGYILTNSHVVENAIEIRVSAAGKSEFPAKLIASDPKTDLAVIKVDEPGLRPIPMGHSKTVQVGDLALAIGNAFGLGSTITMGVISATGRGGLGIEELEDFIQTDAAVNPGNSGGALVNMRGELIGINTAILSRSGGSVGIGFAVPISMARHVMDEIIRTGKVSRPWLGAVLQQVTPDIAKTFGVDRPAGALVADLEDGSPAAAAGIQPGDILLALNEKAIVDPRTFQLMFGQMDPGKSAQLTIFRDGRRRTLEMALKEQPTPAINKVRATERERQKPAAPVFRGMAVETIDPVASKQLGSNKQGVFLKSVAAASESEEAGLQHGDIILQVNRQAVKSQPEFEKMIQDAGNAAVVLFVDRGGETRYVTVRRDPLAH
jgi:serine protease Do